MIPRFAFSHRCVASAYCLTSAMVSILSCALEARAADDLPELGTITVADIPAIEEEVIRRRRTLAAGRVVLSVVDKNLTKGTANSMRYTVVFDDGNFRSDLSSDQRGGTLKEVFTDNDGRIQVPSSSEKHVLVSPHFHDVRQINPVPDPRILGMTPTTIISLNRHGYDGTGVLDPSRRDMELSIVEERGEQLLQIGYEWTAPSGQSIQCRRLLSPDHGYIPVMIEVVYPLPAGLTETKPLTHTLRCELDQYPEFGVSYPSQVVFRREGGSGPTQEQLVVVEDAMFGSVDPKKFTLAGLGLSKGRGIDFAGELGTWDGVSFRSGLGLTDTAGGSEAGLDGGGPRTSRQLLAINAIVFAVIAVILLGLRRHRSRGNG